MSCAAWDEAASIVLSITFKETSDCKLACESDIDIAAIPIVKSIKTPPFSVITIIVLFKAKCKSFLVVRK